jgi:hypothetical protein
MQKKSTHMQQDVCKVCDSGLIIIPVLCLTFSIVRYIFYISDVFGVSPTPVFILLVLIILPVEPTSNSLTLRSPIS